MLTAGKVDDITVLTGNVVIAETILKANSKGSISMTCLLTPQQAPDVEPASNNEFAADLSLINFQKV